MEGLHISNFKMLCLGFSVIVVPAIVMWMDGFDTSGSVSVNASAQVIFQHTELSFQC